MRRRIAIALLSTGCATGGGGGWHSSSGGDFIFTREGLAILTAAAGLLMIGAGITAESKDSAHPDGIEPAGRVAYIGIGVAMMPLAWLIWPPYLKPDPDSFQPKPAGPAPIADVPNEQPTLPPTVSAQLIAQQMAAVAPAVSSCAKQHAGGSLKASVLVAPGGAITGIVSSAPDGTALTPAYTACLDQALRTMRFPPTQQGASFVAPFGQQ